MNVHIKPMPDKYRDIPLWLQPCTPPIFPYMEGQTGPTPSDRKLARKLFNLLDAQSKNWYKRNHSGLFKGLSIKEKKSKKSKKCKT